MIIAGILGVAAAGYAQDQNGELTKVKGVSKKAGWLDDATAYQTQFSGLKGLVAAGDLDAPRTTTQTKNMKRVYTKGNVSPDGHVSPLRLDHW